MGNNITQPEYNNKALINNENTNNIAIYISDVWSEFSTCQFNVHKDYLGIKQQILFNKYILSLAHIHSDASIVYNDLTMISNSELNFTSPKKETCWANDNLDDVYSLMYIRLNQLKNNSNKLSWSFGGAPGVTDYENLKNILNNSSTFSENSIIYKNFSLLKSAFPQVEYIDIDCEEFFDGWENTVVAFCQMLYKIGFKITLCPYCLTEQWVVNIIVPLYQNHKVLIDGLNIQFYAYETQFDSDWNKLLLDNESKIGNKLPEINIGLFLPDKNVHNDYSNTVSDFVSNSKNFNSKFTMGIFFWNYNKVHNDYKYNIKEFNDFMYYIKSNIVL